MGSIEIPAQGSEVIKVPTSNYEFGANFINQRVALLFPLHKSAVECSLLGFIPQCNGILL
jgi:hypothetical protein